jgi:hypothetical protein
MNIKQIQKRVDALSAAMLGKALREPSAEFVIESDAGVRVTLAWQTGRDRYAKSYEFFRGSPEEALEQADDHVAGLPSPEEARMRAFMLSLGETIELGKKVDTEVDFINPLVVLMEKLSKNALTGPVA